MVGSRRFTCLLQYYRSTVRGYILPVTGHRERRFHVFRYL